MSDRLHAAEAAHLQVEKVGGIDETAVELSPGITALVGQNATNRTSLMQALAAALGSDHVTLKGDAQTGEVTLSLGGDTYTRRLERENGDVTVGGDPYLDDPELVDLYAVLLEDNQIRRAVRRGDDLRELIMRPIDTDEIRAEIARLVDERRDIDAELDRLDALAADLPDLEAERQQLREELADVEDRLDGKRATKAQVDTDDTPTDIEAALEDKLASLRDRRSELQTVEDDLDIERKSLASLREERASVTDQYEDLSAPDEQRLATVEERIGNLRDRKRSLETTISELQRIIQFNSERIAEAESDAGWRAAFDDGDEDGAVTADLVREEPITCWTCGSEVQRSRIEGMVDELRTLRRQKREELNALADDLEELTAERDDLQAQRETRTRLSSRLEELDQEIDRRESTVETLEARRTELAERVATLEADIEELQETQQNELLSLQQEVSELEFERDRLAEKLADIESELADIESALEAREDLEARRETISQELTELRTRIDRIETEAVEGFNTHMDTILERLGYENIERIWLEAAERTVTQGRQQVTEQTFELHVVRQSETGATYEDSLDHLSESEREIVGLVVALAGYLVHDVQDQAPFMLLDSLEMVDGERLVELVSYLSDHVPYLVVVLLPDHAEAFDGPNAPEHRRITDI